MGTAPGFSVLHLSMVVAMAHNIPLQVTAVIEEMTKVQIRSGNKPILVHCSDTLFRLEQ